MVGKVFGGRAARPGMRKEQRKERKGGDAKNAKEGKADGARLEAAPPEATQRLCKRCRSASGGAASCRAVVQGMCKGREGCGRVGGTEAARQDRDGEGKGMRKENWR